MKLKNINISLLVLSGLLILSFAFFVVAEEKNSNSKSIFLDSDQDGLADSEEKTYGTDPKNPDTDGDSYKDGTEVKAGYDPLKPAPGDKLPTGEKKQASAPEVKGDETSAPKENLTKSLAQKISAVANEQALEGEPMSMDEIQEMINSSVSEPNIEEELPEITEKDVKIKKQDYKKLSEEEKKAKMKEDFTDYLSAVLYILASNSPEPLTSATNISSVIKQITNQIISALTSRKPDNLNDLEKSGEKIAEQLRDVEVPEDMVETHIKALQYVEYMKNAKSFIKVDSEDPISGLINYSKIQVFVESIFGFYTDIQSKFDEYKIEYGDIQDKIKKYGITLPEEEKEENTIENEEENE